MKYVKRTLIALLALLLLAGCAPRTQDTAPEGFAELKSEALCADEQLNSLLDAFNRTGDGEITAEMVRPGEVGRQVLVDFPAATARLTINESGLYLVFEGVEDWEGLWPLFLHFAQVIQPDMAEAALGEAWAALQTGEHTTYDTLTLGDFAFAALPTEDGWTVKLHHSGKDYLGQKLLFEPSCRRRRNPLIPARPEE